MVHSIEYLAEYITKFQVQCDKYLPQICNPEGKSVLVLGCGWGTEMLWALRHKAASVDGYDMRVRDSTPLSLAVSQHGITAGKFEIHTVQAEKLKPSKIYDVVLSFNAFEHIEDIRGALLTCKAAVGRKAGRISIFSSPLFYSACGHHFPGTIEPWAHVETEEMPSGLSPWQQREFKDLNRITYRAFLDIVVDVGLVMLRSFTVPDPRWPAVSRVRSSVKPFDLALMGFGVELAAP